MQQQWGHDGCGAAGELCTNPQCDKDADSIFQPSTVVCSLEKENRQLEKLDYQAGLIHLPKGTALSPPSSQDISELKA